MAEDSAQRPELREGGTAVCMIDLRNDLDEGDTISAASVAEVTTTDLTFGTVAVTTEEETIEHEVVPARQAIRFTVAGHVQSTGSYRLKVTFSTAGGVIDKVPVEDFVFDVVT